MTTKEWLWSPEPSGARRIVAIALRSASRALAQLARQLSGTVSRSPRRPPVLEFYAEAGAPEGALYVDGQLVGHLPGVTRL
jgi:hypothetical protein